MGLIMRILLICKNNSMTVDSLEDSSEETPLLIVSKYLLLIVV